MGAMRIARTVTGRSTDRDLHRLLPRHLRRGASSRGTQKLQGASRPRRASCAASFGERAACSTTARPSRSRSSASNADDLAAVLVEPVQSRRPDFQPREFLQELRAITEKSGTLPDLRRGRHRLPLRTRAARRRCSASSADLASYGKVIGGGFPIGVIAGKREFMDALDGGALAVRRRLDPDRGRDLLRRHLRAPSAGAGRGQGRRSST